MSPRRKIAPGASTLVIGYIRVSTDDQHLGPEAQRAALERWCDTNRAQLVEIHEDLGISGAASLDKRPGLLAAIDALAEHGAGVLLVAKRDRMARDTMTAAMVERLVERNGAHVLSADGAGNGDGPEAVLMRQMIDAFAQYERAIIRGRTKAALAAKKARGERTGNVPYGFQLAADKKHLEPNVDELAVIDQMRILRESGNSLRQISALLAEVGEVARNGKPFTAQQISLILDRKPA